MKVCANCRSVHLFAIFRLILLVSETNSASGLGLTSCLPSCFGGNPQLTSSNRFAVSSLQKLGVNGTKLLLDEMGTEFLNISRKAYELDSEFSSLRKKLLYEDSLRSAKQQKITGMQVRNDPRIGKVNIEIEEHARKGDELRQMSRSIKESLDAFSLAKNQTRENFEKVADHLEANGEVVDRSVLERQPFLPNDKLQIGRPIAALKVFLPARLPCALRSRSNIYACSHRK